MPRGVGIDYFIQECVGFLDTFPEMYFEGFVREQTKQKRPSGFLPQDQRFTRRIADFFSEFGELAYGLRRSR